MRKKIGILLAVAMMTVALCGCSNLLNSRDKVFSEEDLVFYNGSEEIELQLNQTLSIEYDSTYLEEQADYSYEEYEAGFQTARGLSLGDSKEDYKELYYNEDNYAVWELCDSDNYTKFEKYSGQSAEEMADENTQKWLDTGYYLKDGKWKRLTNIEVKNIWLCYADLEDFDEVVIISANLSDFDEIVRIDVYYFEYDEDFVEYQGWIEE